MIRALIFDFDGTILDTETPEWEAWSAVWVEENCPLPPLLDWTNCIGRGAADLIARFDPYAHLETGTGRVFDRDAVRARRRAQFATRIAKQSLRDGIEAYIHDAKNLGLKCAVASSSERVWVLPHLEQRGLTVYFDAIVCGDDVAHTKPAPDVYLLALDRLSVSANEAIALEDSPNGLTAAKAAGLFAVAFPNPMTCDLDLAHADLRLNALNEMTLTELIAAAEQKSAGFPS